MEVEKALQVLIQIVAIVSPATAIKYCLDYKKAIRLAEIDARRKLELAMLASSFNGKVEDGVASLDFSGSRESRDFKSTDIALV